ncbi:ATP-grasp domain-containing protein [Nonomuraea sp. NPDC050404]|uniref:ATP-grasp domain-containing protein n=1 Tax=Nonomuraea sp. NPDC050404 TaxID=3155783 RepID=UPI003408014C
MIALNVDTGLLDTAHKELQRLLDGRPLVTAERFTTALRTSYTGPAGIEALRPALAIGCYPAWAPALPGAVVAAEDRTRTRSVAERHGRLPRIRHDVPPHLIALNRPPVISAWYATGRLRELAAPDGTVAAIDGELRDKVEAKPVFDQLLRAAEVPAAVRIPCVHVDHLPELGELQRAVGTATVVVQAGVTSGGRGTVFVAGQDDMSRAARLLGPFRVAAFVDGWSSNTTVLSVPDEHGGVRTYVDRPSHKSVGVAALGIGPAKSAGNDWSRPWPAAAAALIVESAQRIAAWAWRRYGMAGLFGLDAILTPDGRLFLNEINWRNQGTTEVSAVNQQLRGLPPFIAAHLTVMLGGRVDWLGNADDFNTDTLTRATQAGGPFYVKARLCHPAPASIAPGYGSGVYRLGPDDRLHRLRVGAHPADADTDRHEVLMANLPGPDIVCHPGAEIATIEGVTSGQPRPFDGPDSASALTRRVHTALHELFHPRQPEDF